MAWFFFGYCLVFPAIKFIEWLFLGEGAFSFFKFRDVDDLFFKLIDVGFLASLTGVLFVYFVVSFYFSFIFFSLVSALCLRRGVQVFFVWFVGLFFILVINSLVFPNSSFSNLLGSEILRRVGVFLVVSVFSAPLLFVFLYKRRWKVALLFLSPAVFFAADTAFYYIDKSIIPAVSKENVIIIGVDSLRPDIFYSQTSLDTRVIEMRRFLRNSYDFENAWTPVARTYVSWSALLSGMYPSSTNVRFNLSPNSQSCGLVSAFKDNNWNTVFWSDEKHFNHIGSRCGFKHNLGASERAIDFIFSKLLDTPFVNIMTLYPYISRFVIPHNVINRPAYVTYSPHDSAKIWVEDIIDSMGGGNNFVAAHFTILHWPWSWKDSKELGSEDLYASGLKEQDAQFSLFLQRLRQVGALEGSVVILLSDHGESFARSIPSLDENYTSRGSSYDRLVGHGTDVMSLSQNRIVLGFLLPNGFEGNFAQRDALVNIVDIAPTLADLYGLKKWKWDGLSLKSSSINELNERAMPFETGYSFHGLVKRSPDLKAIVNKGIKIYDIRDGKLEIKHDYLDEMLSGKEAAELKNGVMRGLDSSGGGYRCISSVGYYNKKGRGVYNCS